jgi:hypothetical protein
VVDATALTGSFSVSGATTINGQLATANQTPTLTLSYSGSGAAAYQMQFSTDGGATWTAWQAYASIASVTLPSGDGIDTVIVHVSDVAGNVTTSSLTLRLDRTGPTITSSTTAPTNAGAYDIGASLVLTYGGTDTDNVSTISALVDGTASISSGGSVNLCTHTIVITAKDGLGNVSTSTITFTVHATISGLINAVNYGSSKGTINSSTASSLLSTLNAALTAFKASNLTLAQADVQNFLTQVQGASSNKISTSYAALLVNWAQDLIPRL